MLEGRHTRRPKTAKNGGAGKRLARRDLSTDESVGVCTLAFVEPISSEIRPRGVCYLACYMLYTVYGIYTGFIVYGVASQGITPRSPIK